MGARYPALLAASALAALALALYALLLGRAPAPQAPGGVEVAGGVVHLPLPRRATNLTVEEAILWRRSIRAYAGEPLTIDQLSMILWAAYGVTDPFRGFRASPSAGATYPLEVYVVVGEGGVRAGAGYLPPGSYKYDPRTHSMRLVRPGDLRGQLYEAALGQPWVRDAPVSLVICAVYERTTARYGERGYTRYVPMEAGHAGQNVYLMATALGLGTVAVGAFSDERVAEAVGAGAREVPLYIMPVGVPAERPSYTFEDVARSILEARGSGPPTA